MLLQFPVFADAPQRIAGTPWPRCDVDTAKAQERADANTLTSTVIALYTLTFAAHAAEPDVDQPTAAWAAAHYRDFQRITPTPVLADPALLMLCTTLTPASIDRQLAKDGPHALTKISIFMNATAARAFHAADAVYPVGSVIVKEKVPDSSGRLAKGKYRLDQGAEKADALVRMAGSGGMIKRPAGYDPAHGDWEYLYFKDPRVVEHGKIATCIECHDRARATDHVYGSWAAGQDGVR